ncbi:ThiF family adenylyltransferase [Dactylosporangium sp. AC04546]|uniref:HesA/MoeB/ThiF family protein n=1 Tax=Dactylosporangium sp. AC04546 TaxID=2862460 RepID=UPI001EDF8A84|nr:ThiF family adenylyltransferase [Dactylosporangium sp. AC04546]WVK83358.1 ThiF family adenylyltransferase [Dactylosporangium sp. AC04546]
MPVRPKLKSISVLRRPAEVVLIGRPYELTHLADEDGAVTTLLQVLAQGSRTVAELPTAMRERGFDVTEEEMAAAVEALDQAGVLLRADGDADLDDATLRRHASNLRFYDLYSDLRRTSAGFHRAMATADVLLLGAGGMGSGVLQSLIGLGVGRIRLVDCDVVEEKNLARQFAYGHADVGRNKVDAARDWAARYSPGTTVVDTVHERVSDADTVRRLGAGASLVVSAIDSPDDIQLIVNEACFDLGVPFVTAGLLYSTIFYWSVEPGVSPCRLCLELNREDQGATMPHLAEQTVAVSGEFVNRATGPVAQLLAGFVTLEAARYLTRTDPPVAAATYHTFDLVDGMRTTVDAWPRHPGCPLCHRSPEA